MSAGLRQAEEIYGVPPEIVVGIVGVETIYGQQMGNFRVIDALATLAFDFPAGRKDRSAFFRDELESLFVLWPQRRPRSARTQRKLRRRDGHAAVHASSFNKYAVDMDGDGPCRSAWQRRRRDRSVAHYLAEFSWRRGLPTRFGLPCRSTPRTAPHCSRPTSCPASRSPSSRTRRQYRPCGAGRRRAPRCTGGVGKLALVELPERRRGTQHVAGTSNFYAITRYNWSSYYALQ